jgi:hypothetical protein
MHRSIRRAIVASGEPVELPAVSPSSRPVADNGTVIRIGLQ